jgi:hypothetical protein
MSQGLRIFSSNLNGKTGVVTFLPASGGSYNLGTKTIPFTNTTNYPYGTYQIYIGEYDYTYQIVVPVPEPLQSGYTDTVRTTYINAGLADFWGSYTEKFITDRGFDTTKMVYAAGNCADDVNAPKFNSISNIGQFPASTNTLLGPFMSGGLAGYPFVGSIGLGAWASHIASESTTTGGTLFISSMPHIGISSDGKVGRMIRRGKTSNNNDSTCGAVAGAIGQVLSLGSVPAFPQASPSPYDEGNFQFWKLVDILFPYKSELEALIGGNADETFGLRMDFATRTIRDAAKDYILTNLPAAITGVTHQDVFFFSGIFVNTDDGYEGYVAVDEFKYYNYSIRSWVDLTSEYLAGFVQ